MTDRPPSESMTPDEIFAQGYHCPDCGKIGELTDPMVMGSSSGLIQIVEGLDLDNCDGCRKVLAAQGGVQVVKKWGRQRPRRKIPHLPALRHRP